MVLFLLQPAILHSSPLLTKQINLNRLAQFTGSTVTFIHQNHSIRTFDLFSFKINKMANFGIRGYHALTRVYLTWAVLIALCLILCQFADYPASILNVHMPPSCDLDMVDWFNNGTEVDSCLRSTPMETHTIQFKPHATPYPYDDKDIRFPTTEAFDMTTAEFNELYDYMRIMKTREALAWSNCDANLWPELDIAWCLASWDNGVLVDHSV